MCYSACKLKVDKREQMDASQARQKPSYAALHRHGAGSDGLSRINGLQWCAAWFLLPVRSRVLSCNSPRERSFYPPKHFITRLPLRAHSLLCVGMHADLHVCACHTVCHAPGHVCCLWCAFIPTTFKWEDVFKVLCILPDSKEMLNKLQAFLLVVVLK